MLGIPPWLPTLLSGLCVALFTAILNRQVKRDEKLQFALDQVAELRLLVVREYFSNDQAGALITKLDAVIQDLHRQNLALARIETELKASRQAVLASAQHHVPQ